MKKFKKWIRREMDVEFFACVHGVSIIWMYGFILWCAGISRISFSVVTEMLIVGYIAAWFQKLLFIREKRYGKWEYRIRIFIWCAGPYLMLLISQFLFRWFAEIPIGFLIGYDAVMAVYYPMLWLFIDYFYREETGELNQMLAEWQKHQIIEETEGDAEYE